MSTTTTTTITHQICNSNIFQSHLPLYNYITLKLRTNFDFYGENISQIFPTMLMVDAIWQIKCISFAANAFPWKCVPRYHKNFWQPYFLFIRRASDRVRALQVITGRDLLHVNGYYLQKFIGFLILIVFVCVRVYEWWWWACMCVLYNFSADKFPLACGHRDIWNLPKSEKMSPLVHLFCNKWQIWNRRFHSKFAALFCSGLFLHNKINHILMMFVP